jgi:hypothetical protein
MKKKKSKKEIYENLLAEHRPTIRGFVLEILKTKLLNLQKTKESATVSGAVWIPEEDRLKNLELKYIAIINKDNVVVEMIRINEETASYLLDSKTKLVTFDPKAQTIKKGMWYTKGKFNAEGKNDKKS